MLDISNTYALEPLGSGGDAKPTKTTTSTTTSGSINYPVEMLLNEEILGNI